VGFKCRDSENLLTGRKFMDQTVAKIFESYPDEIRVKLLGIRELIYQVASQEKIENLVETLKWGEPSYIAKQGSTVRIDWKSNSPNQVAVYFNCNTKLVETFKEIYGEVFKFEGNRAIVFSLNEKIPDKQLAHCIALSLRYKQLKKLPMLGA
jgi:hypothetical protein